MATESNLPQSVQPSKPAVVVPFKWAPQQITQRDLVEYAYFKKLAREAREQFEAKEADLRAP